MASVGRAVHVGVLPLLAKRTNDVGRACNRTLLSPARAAGRARGGVPDEINASSAEPVDDLRHLDEQLRQSKQRIAQAVAVAGTSLTDLFGVSPVVVAMLTARVRACGAARFASVVARRTGRG